MGSSDWKTKNKEEKIHWDLLICLFLIISTLVVYWQVRNYDFVNYDDGLYVTQNMHVRAGLTWESIKWAFTAIYTSNWHPLTWLSHLLDVELYGMNPGQHHLTNVLFHIANTLLLFFVFCRMAEGAEVRSQRSGDGTTISGLWQSAFVAALFALHPLHVESVAWVSERKDVLSTFFWMLTLWSYISYVENPGAKNYLTTLLFFILGLMSKPMLVTLPFVLLLLDYWPLRRFPASRFSRLAWEKTPFFALTAASCVITFLAQKSGGSVGALDVLPLDVRVANALVSYISYIGKMIWPQHLAVLYPHPGAVPLWQAAGAFLLLASASFLVVRNIRQRPWLATGWFWYMGTLVPVIGLVQVGKQALADRYTYIPLIGLFIMAAWGIPEILTGWRHRNRWLTAFATVILFAFAAVAWTQTRYWANSITLYEHALRVTTGNDTVHYNLGNALLSQGKFDKAIKHYSEALRFSPDAETYNNLGLALFGKGNTGDAIKYYAKALQKDPRYEEAHNNLGNAFAALGKLDKAIFHYSESLRIFPGGAGAHNNLGLALIRRGHIGKAVAHFQESLRIKPYYTGARNNLGRTLAIKGKIDEAVRKIRESLDTDPRDPMLPDKLKNLYASKKELDDAISQYHKALSPQPGYRKEALDINNYNKVYVTLNEYDAISSLFRQLGELDPESAEACYHIACIYARQEKTEESVEWLKKAFSKGDILNTDKNLENIRNSPYCKELLILETEQ